MPLDQHLGYVRQKEEPEVPAPHALLPELRRHVLRRPETRLLQPEPGNLHLAETQLLHPVAVHGAQRVRVIGAAVFAVDVEGLVAELRHEVRHVVRVGAGVVALGGGRLVSVAEAAQVGGDDGEVRCQQRQEAVPVEAVFGGAVEEQDGFFALASGDAVHADAIDAIAVVFGGFAVVVVGFCFFGGHCFGWLEWE